MIKRLLKLALSIGLLLPVFLNWSCGSRKSTVPENFDLQGHRGAMGLKPENTIPGFIKAAELGVNTIEFDLAVSEDQKLVVSHDPWFRSDICLQPDQSPIPGQQERAFRLYEMPYSEIKRFDCGSLQNPSHPGQKTLPAKKPLMTDAITAVDKHVAPLDRKPVRYNIEIKSNPAWDQSLTPDPETFAKLLLQELSQLQKTLDENIFKRVNIQSFDPRPLKAFREIAPNIPIAILTYEVGSVDEHIENFGFLPEIYSPNYGILTPEHIERCRELGIRIIPWTVNRPEDIRNMVELGVSGLITDYPNRFFQLYKREEG